NRIAYLKSRIAVSHIFVDQNALSRSAAAHHTIAQRSSRCNLGTRPENRVVDVRVGSDFTTGSHRADRADKSLGVNICLGMDASLVGLRAKTGEGTVMQLCTGPQV